MSKSLAFFVEHTPVYVDPVTFEPVYLAAHVLRCRGLRDAERWGQRIGLNFVWMPDADADTFSCLATYNGCIVAEVSGVELDGEPEYARVVQAELSQDYWRRLHTPAQVQRPALAIA